MVMDNYSEVESVPEHFELDGAPRERTTNRKRRPKGNFRKLNSENRLHGSGYIKFNAVTAHRKWILRCATVFY